METRHHPAQFVDRHVGLDDADIADMIRLLGLPSLDALIDETVPKGIRLAAPLSLPGPVAEHELLAELCALAGKNRITRSMIGAGYADCITPSPILRNILENPAWYTAYTPYQAEISQGRLEALLNFQTMVCDLTGMEVSNASLLDEGTAAAEAVTMVHRLRGEDAPQRFFVDAGCHPQTVAVIKGRAEPVGIEIVVGEPASYDAAGSCLGALVQIPSTEGRLWDARALIERAHQARQLVVVATDLLACALVAPPGELGADVVIGSTQRFGVPLGFGGPHAAFLATKHAHVRQMPGRLIGVSTDAQGRRALRMALQTREQHIRREKATSNVCTAQVLLAVLASMYAVYHGPAGIKAIAERVHGLAKGLADQLAARAYLPKHACFFDTVVVDAGPAAQKIWEAARARGVTLRRFSGSLLGVALDETTTGADVDLVVESFATGGTGPAKGTVDLRWPRELVRTSSFLTHDVFNSHHSEHELLRYIKSLELKDYSLVHGMIPLGSCTMKLNAATEMLPVTWPEWGKLHPFCPAEDHAGYDVIVRDLERWLAEITGFAATSLQPNAGSQGELAGMLVIRAYHKSRGQAERDVVLIPRSAHGTNPASAVMAGLKVVVVETDARGNIDVEDLRAKVREHAAKLCALMVTYPSTHGVFEDGIQEMCQLVHDAGGQIYMDGANMNAQVGLTRPGTIGADVAHLNLHKTFAIPHGGGGPGVGPICVAAHLAPFLPGHPCADVGGKQAVPAISAAPWGSASVALISWAYIKLMGAEGLTHATKLAILSANYVAKRLERHFPTVYAGRSGRVAHECILELRPLKESAGIEAEDVAKRLMDYGFHAPTLSFPVPGTLMVEPTESEPKAELDRFVDALVAIRAEIDEVQSGAQPREGNVLKSAPHTMHVVCADEWTRPYSREKAAFPTAWTRKSKLWPAVGRLNNVAGDRKLVCLCPPVEG
ncbi:MAG: glycine dehydrogenase (aminomethyl-transferring) [Deltaproteobacteria bacterium RBG_16_71_12]|nr:MAG: glycine dehydrogenase (aminomethyl-transferring) [Deltaproteobacteria bacterium RBG_16_71_12]